MAGIKYYTVTSKPTIPAKTQHGGVSAAIAVNDLVFDWVELQIPRGSSKLVSLTMIFRNNATGKPTDFAGDIYFSNSGGSGGDSGDGDGSGGVNFGVGHNTPNALPMKAGSLIGKTSFATSDWCESGVTFSAMTINPNIVLTSKAGSDKVYYCVTTQTNNHPDFESGVYVAESNFGAGEQTAITVDDSSGGSSNAATVFAPGDVIHADNNEALGTVSSINATTITLTAPNIDACNDNKRLYNINPITLIFGFECA